MDYRYPYHPILAWSKILLINIIKKILLKILFVLYLGIVIIVDTGCQDIINNGTEITKEWLFMLYLDGDCDLESYAIMDFNLIENSLYKLPESVRNNIKIIALMDRHINYDTTNDDWTGARIFELKPDEDSQGYLGQMRSTPLSGWWGSTETELHMGDPETLDNFIEYTLNNYPDYNNKWLSIWGHGAGVRTGISFDDSDGYDPLYVDEIQQALSLHFSSTDKLDVLHLQGCLMGMVEIAYEFRNLTNYMTATPNIGGAGRPVFGNLFDNITDTITPRELSILTVQQYKEAWKAEDPHYRTCTAVDLSNLENIENLKTNIDILGQKLYLENNKNAIEGIRDATLNYYDDNGSTPQHYPYHELGDLCNNLISNPVISTDVKTAAQDVLDALGVIVIYAWADINKGNYEGYGTDIKRGLSIVFPHGNLLRNDGITSYLNQYWYTNVDVSAWYSGNYYGKIDFSTSNENGIVETWRELFEAWYDQPPENNYTPGNY